MTDVNSSATVPAEGISARGFSVFDPALPLLAAKAALQLDKLRIEMGSTHATEAQVDAVEKLQHLLQGTADSSQQGTQRALVDPLSARVLSEAVSQFGDKKRINSFEELWTRLAELLTLLNPATLRALKPDELATARDFFLALSNHAAAGQSTHVRVRPTSRYRKLRLG
jgi:hypothetical protein